MLFSEWKAKKKKNENEQNQTTTTPTTPERTETSQYKSPASFSEWKQKKNEYKATPEGWYEDSRQLLNDVQDYYLQYRTEDDYYKGFQDRTSKLLSTANNLRTQYQGNTEAISYIDSVASALSGITDFAKKKVDYYSQWESEDAYKSDVQINKWLNRYKGKSYADLKDALANMDQGTDEYNWLTQYAPTTMTAQDYDNELAPIESELQKVQADYDEYRKINNMYRIADDETKQRYKDILNQYGSAVTLKGRLEELKSQKYSLENKKKYNLLSENKDFDTVSKEITGKRPWAEFGVDAYSYINNIDGYRDEKIADSSKSLTPNLGRKYDFMTDQEVATYNYIYNTEGKKAANKYLEFIEPSLNEQLTGVVAQTAAQVAETHPGFASVASVPLNLISGVGALDVAWQNVEKSLSEAFTGEYSGPIDYNRPTMGTSVISSTIRGTVSENLANEYGIIEIDEEEHPFWSKIFNGKSLGDVYQLGMSMVDSAAIAALSPVLGTAGTYLLGGSAASQGILDAVSAGASDEQALMMGIINGAFELIFEKYELDKLLNNASDGFIKATFKQALSEGAGEGATTIFNTLGDAFIMAEKSDWQKNINKYTDQGLSLREAKTQAFWDALAQVSWDIVGGMATGGIMGGGASVVEGVVNSYNQVQTEKDAYSSFLSDLIAESLEIAPDNKLAKEIQAKLDQGKKVSGTKARELGKFNEATIREQDTASIQKATVSRLTELGESGDVETLGSALTKQAKGEKLSKAEQQIISNSKYGQRVANELNTDNIRSGEYSSAWAERIGTNKLNAEEYGRLLEEAQATEESTVNVADNSQGVQIKDLRKDVSVSSPKAETPKTSVTESDKITIERDGEEVEVKVSEIASVEDGEVMLKLEDGEVVSADEVNYGATGVALVYNAASDMASRVGGFNTDTANVFVKGFDPNGGLTASEYVHGFSDAYRFGTLGYPVSELASGVFTSKLSEKQRTTAYNLGKAFGNDEVALKQEKIASIGTINSTKNANKASKTRKGKLYFDGTTGIKNLTNRQSASVKVLRVIAEGLGVDIHVFESPVGKDGQRQGANGWFDPKDNSIHIDLYAGAKAEGLMLFTAAHELTHFIRKWSPAKFKTFADFLLETYNKNGAPVEELVQKKVADLMKNGRITSNMTDKQIYDLAYEEVVADSCEAMLTDSNAIEKIAELRAKDKTLWEKIKEFIDKLVERIKAAYEGLNPDSVEGQAVRAMKDSAEKLQALWTEALIDAGEAYSSTEEMLAESGIIVDNNTDSASLMSVRYLLEDKQKDKVVEALSERFGVTTQEAEGWISAETSLASLILNPKYSQYLDYTADDNEEAIKSNSDYPQGTVDFSNICKKRRDFTEVMNRVLRNFPNHVFAATDLAKIRTIMEEEGMEVACAICYVEDRRQLDSVVAQNFIDSLALYRSGSKMKPDGTPFNTNQLNAFKLIEGDTYTPSIYELISLEGRNKLKEKNPAMEAAWVKFNNARGMQSVRLLLNDAEYKRQILKYNSKTVQSKNNLGGLRIYSFSDMEMFHLIDIIQVITDSATVGLSLQGYTKVNEYAKAVKDTGEKLNRSLIPKGDLGYHLEDGKVVLDFDTVEGIDINHPDFFDNIDNPNIGNIVIGINATQIRAAMTSKFIDQIIPFHTGQSNEVLGEKGIAAWDNYKDFQSERDISTGKKSNHQINIYTEVIQAAEAEGKPITNKVDFVNKFLEVCKENSLEPRFSEFLNVDENGDYVYTEGYHKFLVDFKTFDQNTGEYLPQMPVKPIFDNGYITQLLKDHVKTQKVKDAEFKKALPNVLDRITSEIVEPTDSDKLYSFRGTNKDGIEVYETSEDIKKLSYKERMDAFKTIMEKEYNGRTAKFTRNGHTYYAFFDSEDVDKNIYGDKLSSKKGWKAKVNVGADGNIFELVENATYNGSKAETGKKIATHRGVGYWDYFIKTVQVDDIVFDLVANVRRKPDDSFVYSIQLNENKKIEASPSLDSLLRVSNRTLNASKGSISQPDDSVNKKFSDRDSAGNTLSKEQQEFFKDSKVRDANGNLLVAYHVTPSDIFYEFDSSKYKSNSGTGVWGKGFYFSDEKASYYWSGEVGGKNELICYLNIKKPFIVGNRAKVPVDFKDYIISTNAYKESNQYRKDYLGENASRWYDFLRFSAKEDANAVLQNLGYDGIIVGDNYEIVIFNSNQAKLTSNKAPTENEDIRYSDRPSQKASYAPTFYSYMGKVVDEIKLEKMSTGGVVPYLKGKGVKNEEIKWSGIEAFLEGKRSVTKAELQEFVAGSQLQIEEEMSDTESFDIVQDGKDYIVKDKNGNILDTWEWTQHPEDPDLQGWMSEEEGDIVSSLGELREYTSDWYGSDSTRWSQYRLDGGANYRELVFRMPNSSYNNRAMKVHWGQDAEGVLAHVRVQDMTTKDGKRMLFVEELQSDWHNEGHQKGYTTMEYEDAVAVYDKLAEDYANKRTAFNRYVRSGEFRSDTDEVSKKKFDWLRRKMDEAEKRMQDAERDINALKEKGMGDVPDAPFHNNYHEYVLKRLLRMAAEEDYDSIGWTTADIQSDRWSDEFAEGYRIEYDQDIPKFLRKYGKKWGATVGRTTLEQGWASRQEKVIAVQQSHIADWENSLSRAKSDHEKEFIRDQIKYHEEQIKAMQISGETVWSMDITDTMKDSVLYEGQVMYSDRDPDSVSNRSLLANALESVAQNDIERNKLTEYKGKIALIEAEQAKLSELRGKIKELSFAKGPRDAEAIRSLQFEANQTANRINTYDRQLLNLESTKALKGVLEREKKLAYKKAEQKGKDALARYKEKAAETEKVLMNRYQESRKRGIEGRHKTEMRHKIKGVVNELNQYLLKGTKEKHVPIGLQKAVAEALEAVNMDTVGAEERIAKLEQELMKAKSPEMIQEISKRIDHIREMGDRMDKKLQSLKTSYDDFVNSDDPLIANSHDEVISNSISKVINEVGSTPLRDMSLNQLEAVYDLYKMVLTSVRNANKAFKAAKNEEISVIANRVMEEIDKVGKNKTYQPKIAQLASKFDWNNLKPVYAFERIGSDTFSEVFKSVRAGEDTWAEDITEAKEFSTKQREKFKYKSWDFKKRYGFTSTSGMKFELSLDQIMSLYAYSKRPQARDHLRKGGIVFDETTEVTVKTKLGIPVKFNPTQATAYNISDETLADIISTLTPDQKGFVDIMQDYLSTVMGAKGNEVSLELYGVKLYKEKNYFPLKSATQFMAKAKEQQKGEVKVKNSGFSKETVAKANNPIVLTPFMDVWADHVNDMSMYHAFVLPLEDFYRVYNYKTPTSDTMATESVEMYLQNAYGKAAPQYIDQLLKDLNGGARSDPTVGVINKLTGLFKKSAVFASLSVVIQQPSAIARATALVDSKNFVGLPSGKHSETWAEVKKYAPIAIIKEMGYFDTGMGQSTVEWIKDEKTWKDKVDDVASKAPALADELAWCSIWKAVKREMARRNPSLKTNSEEFLKLVGERFTDVIVKTQVYDSVLSRSANMRSKDTGMKMATAFMGEPTTSLNMLENALTQAKRGDKKKAAKAIGGVISSMVLNSILVSIVYAGRDDDEDKTYLEKYLSTLTEELIDSINPLTLIPFVKDVVSIMQGYDVERSDMAIITDLIDAWNNLEQENRSAYRKVEDFAGAIASIFGLPVKNVMRDVRGIYNTINSFINGEDTTGAGVKVSLKEALTGDDITDGQQLYEAILNGDTAQIERVKGRFKDQKAIDSAINKALRENDPRIKEAAEAKYNGDIAEYMRIAKEIVAEGYFKQDNIVSAINSEINALEKEDGATTSSGSSKFKSLYEMSDYYTTIRKNDTLTANSIKADIINTDIKNGKTKEEAEKNFKTKLTSEIKDKHSESKLTDVEAKNLLVKYNGMSQKDAVAKVQYWSFQKNYPDYELSENAVGKYYEYVKPSGIGAKMYYDYYKEKSKCIGIDSNGDGRADAGTVKAEILALIDSLPLTTAQKDALYFAEGSWKEELVNEAPWH